jgi:NAD(P)H-flavin reductase
MGSSAGPRDLTEQTTPQPAAGALLTERRDAGGGLVEIVLSVADEVRVSYVAPGQYTQITAGGEERFFVLSGDPGAPNWRFLTRGGGGASDHLLALPLESVVTVTAAQGRGFPYEVARSRDLLIAVTGTGIAAARPLVRARVRDGVARRTEVFVGVRKRSDAPLAVELDAWRKEGVSVTLCLSAEDADGPGARRGYVQDIVQERAPSHPGGVIFAAGVPEMVEALRRIAARVGLREDDVYTNH